MSADRRPPGTPRRSRLRRSGVPPIERADTTPLDVPPPSSSPAPPGYAPPGYGPPPAYGPPPGYTSAPPYGPPQPAPYGPPPAALPAGGFQPPPYGPPPGNGQVPPYEPPYEPPPAPFGPPGDPGASKVTVARVAAARTRELTGNAVRRVQAASRADGAGESGLSHLLWVNALHMAGDALIAVSLAGTLFFAAAAGEQRSNVALYLLITMAPFAVVAPIIGPALDRLQRGRRWAMAASLVGRAVLALVLARHIDDIWLYPAALGVLVLSKAHNVLRAAVVPRVLPPTLPLTSANARLSIFGLLTAGVVGGIGAGLAALFGLGFTLWVTAAVFATGGVLASRLPRHVDVPTGELPADVFTTTAEIPVLNGRRRRPVTPHVVLGLRANAALKGLGGFLTIFSAFLVNATFPGGWEASLALGAVAAAAGIGVVIGTAVGTRLRTVTPEHLVVASAGTAAVITLLAAIFYSFGMAILVAGVSAITNALAKVALDAMIQTEVPESLRASAFARSETWLQLAWVVGGAIGIALPPTGWIGFTVAASLLVVAVGVSLWSMYRGFPRLGRRAAEQPAPTVSPDSPTTPLGPQWS